MLTTWIVTGVSLNPAQGQDEGTPPIGSPSSTLGGTRGSCQGAILQADPTLTLTALVPSHNILYTSGQTPNLYVYLPTIAGKQAFVRVMDLATEEVLFQSQPFDLNRESAITQLVLPDSVQLTPKPPDPDILPYQWDLFVQCDPDDPEQDLAIGGWIWPLDTEAAQVGSYWIERLDQAFVLWPDNPQVWQARLTEEDWAAFTAVPLTTLELLP